MPDAKGVDGPQPRPSLLRAAAARRPIRKPGEAGPAAPPSGGFPPATQAPAAQQAPPAERPARPAGSGCRLDDLYRMPMPNLFKLAEKEGIHEHTGMTRAQLIVGIVRRQIERGEVVRGSGTLEVLPDGYGFLRSQAHNYLASPEDIYVSPSQIRRMSLRTGLVVEGPIRLPIENQDNFALMQIELVNGKSPDEGAGVTSFEDLTPLHPDKRLVRRPPPTSCRCGSSIWSRPSARGSAG
jgi:transcription termination factor Rho